MAPPPLNWTSMFAYDGDQERAFEELAFQIVKVLHGHDGQLIRVDDSGGGDGVEFYLERENGEEWGWQTKFFPNGRLDKSNRYSQVRKSLEKALDIHSGLTKWTLCTPINFTTREQAWFDNRPDLLEPGSRKLPEPLPCSVPGDRIVELSHWGDATFHEFLSDPRFLAKRYYFFGELHLDLDWFANQFAARTAGLKEKFNPALHIESHVDHAVNRILGDVAFTEYIAAEISRADESLKDFDQSLQNLRFERMADAYWEAARTEILATAETLGPPLRALRAEAATMYERLAAGELRPTGGIDCRALLEAEETARGKFREILNRVDEEARPSIGAGATQDYALRSSANLAGRPGDASFGFSATIREVFEEVEGIELAALHVLGPAGAGKTHVACQICTDRLGRKLPALFLPGKLFASDAPLSKQIREILGVPPVYGWEDFLGALDVTAQAHRTKIPIVIDGLNEAVVGGTLAPVWGLHLHGVEQEITRYPNLALITTCRSSYQPAIWPGNGPENSVELSGFDYENIEDAVRRYFERYRIVGDVTLASLSEFQLPLYLKLFCEAKNPGASRDVPVYVGQDTLFEVFDEYLSASNAAVCDRLQRPSQARIVQHGLRKLAATLWEQRERTIPAAVAYELVDGQPFAEVALNSSVMKAMLDEGLLVTRDWQGDGEIIGFTYDLLGGYLVADSILAEYGADLESFFGCEDNLNLLFSQDWQRRHPMAEDIARCMAALMPRRSDGRYLHDFTDDEEAYSVSVSSLFEIAPRLVSPEAVVLISDLFEMSENREGLLELSSAAATHVDHPLNALFWSNELEALPVADRDIAWSEHLRFHLARYESLVKRFEAASRDAVLSDVVEQRIHLLAPLLRWCLTSTIRPFRDRVTRALYWYGRRWPIQLLDLTLASLATNDPYVPERMLASVYGVGMARQWDFANPSFSADTLPKIGRGLYATMFRREAPHATTHILARDYARHTIEICLLHHPTLLSTDEIARIKPPFQDGGIRAWGEEQDRNPNEYRYGNRPIDLYDHNPMEELGIASKYDTGSSGYQRAEANLWWRAYSLGYSLDRFGMTDQSLARLDGEIGGDRFEKRVYGYGEKYVRIAAMELAGCREDALELEERRNFPGDRLSLTDIDPSFPESEPDRPVISSDFLGDRSASLQEWILTGSDPDISSYLVVDVIDGQHGPWILLDGFVVQEDSLSHRGIFLFCRGLLLSSRTVDVVVSRLQHQDLGNRWLPEVPHDVYRFAGEIPWCETYPANGCDQLRFEIGTKNETVTEHRWFRKEDGVEIDGTLDRILTHYGTFERFLSQEGNGTAIEDEPAVDGGSLSVPGTTAGGELELREVPDERRVEIFDTHQVVIPVRTDGWESYHSVVVPGRSVNTPAREITDSLGLVGQPQTFDLFESDGRRASITVASGDLWKNGHQLAYLRMDLLDRFLKESEQGLVWGIWGERQVANASLSKHLPETQIETKYKVFQRIERYIRSSQPGSTA
ncbi:MAG: hypothetical protein M9947_17515 [Thermomicrobiales bacterium]|nr:hypothetical protein [Thermomicrobiales bacterium]